MKRIILLMLALLGAGCGTFSPPLDQPTSTSSVILPMATVMPLPEPTPTNRVPTSSQFPTLPSAEAEAMVIDLLENNGGCLLPCWWGLTPGKTNKKGAQSLFESLATDSSSVDFYDTVGGASWLIDKDGLLLDLIVSFVHDRNLADVVESFSITMEVKRELSEGGFETVWENPLNERYLQAYRLPLIMSTYGQPERILVSANKGWKYFNLILDYSDRGFAVWYSAPLESSGDKYIGCMSKSFTRLYLWAPEFAYTWAEGVVGTGDLSEIASLNRDFRPLEEVTLMTTEDFYIVFRNTNNRGCIETPKNIWPGP